jgi:hypothetical protein
VLQDEHAGLYDAVDDLDDTRATDAEGWRRGVVAVLHDLDQHMFKEDYGLFPAALATLDGADWDAMDQWEDLHSASWSSRRNTSTSVPVFSATRGG